MVTPQAVPPSAAAVYAEKSYITHVDDASASSNTSKHEADTANEAVSQYSPKEARRLRRTIDLRLIPALGLMCKWF